jgi:hypothetical protein
MVRRCILSCRYINICILSKLYCCVQLLLYPGTYIVPAVLLCESCPERVPAVELYCTAVCSRPGASTCCRIVLYSCYCTLVCSCPGTSTGCRIVLYSCVCTVLLNVAALLWCCIVLYGCVQLSWYKYLLLYCILLLRVGFLV